VIPVTKLLALSLAGVMIAGTALAQTPGSRRTFDFKRLDTGLGLSQAQLMYQAEHDLLGQKTTVNSTSTSTNNITSNQTTAAESLTNITTDCGSNALCQIDAAFSRSGAGSQSSGQTMGTGTQTGTGSVTGNR
jgi:hypothetical protein